jgi:ABC-2 type transport system permease protein
MTHPPNTPMHDPFADQPSSPIPLAQTRPFYWSVRRELWENRSIYLAPLVVAMIVAFACLISTTGLPRRVRAAQSADPPKQHAVLTSAYSMAPAPIVLTTFLVGLFYCLDALHGERRDRSILFWKSLPVSDRTTVLSKAAIPLAVLPLIGLALGMVAQLSIFLLSSAVLAGSGLSPALLWSQLPFIQAPLVMIYGVTVHVLWFAPIYAWLLLVSAWSRRTPILWAALPPVAILIVERISNLSLFRSFLQYRLIGAMTEAYVPKPSQTGAVIDRVAQLDPAKFLSTPGLWFGLLFAAAFLAAAVRLRRNREPT